jgi:hypothetical protein
MYNEHFQVGSSDAVLIWAIFLFLGDGTGIKVYRFFDTNLKGFFKLFKFKLV